MPGEPMSLEATPPRKGKPMNAMPDAEPLPEQPPMSACRDTNNDPRLVRIDVPIEQLQLLGHCPAETIEQVARSLVYAANHGLLKWLGDLNAWLAGVGMWEEEVARITGLLKHYSPMGRRSTVGQRTEPFATDWRFLPSTC